MFAKRDRDRNWLYKMATEKPIEEKKENHLIEDLKVAPFATFLGGVIGFCSSFLFPYAISESVKKISNGEVKNFSQFMFFSAGSLGYLGGLASIAYLLAEYGDKPEAWIPIGTNLVSGAAQYAYRRGKEKGINQTGSQSGLESKVAGA